jgi:dUTP pyrophosphatase
MIIKFKKLHENAQVPKQGREGDAAWDLVAISKKVEEKYVEYGTGIAIVVPEDCVGLIFPRSSVSSYDLILSNCVGVIDHNYRGEVRFRFKPVVRLFDTPWLRKMYIYLSVTTGVGSAMRQVEFANYEPGDKIGQLIILPRPFLEFEEVKELDKTNRNADGFGSSGK